MRFISVLSALSLVLVVIILWPSDPQSSAFSKTCVFVSERIFLSDTVVRPWLQECLHLAQLNRKQSLPFQREMLRSHLSSLNVSHLDLFEPQEVQNIWSENKKSTGIISEFIDGQLIITAVLPRSPAEQAQVKVGDQLISINDEAPSPRLAQEISGEYVFDRKGKPVVRELSVNEIAVDEKWKVFKRSAKSAQLKVPSFRSEYFEKQALEEMAKQLEPYQKIILDLRKNEGGNFVSGLRLLSLFFCGSQELGYLIRPKFLQLPKVELPDQLDDAEQFETLNKSYYVNLRTFEKYPCLAQSLIVLVDNETASTSELVAQALKDYRGAKVLGHPTGGKLLVGVWYPLPGLGSGVKISIPEAIYQTKRGRQIESHGVLLDEILDYRREDFENGQDSWLTQALGKF